MYLWTGKFEFHIIFPSYKILFSFWFFPNHSLLVGCIKIGGGLDFAHGLQFAKPALSQHIWSGDTQLGISTCSSTSSTEPFSKLLAKDLSPRGHSMYTSSVSNLPQNKKSRRLVLEWDTDLMLTRCHPHPFPYLKLLIMYFPFIQINKFCKLIPLNFSLQMVSQGFHLSTSAPAFAYSLFAKQQALEE